jgi:hypothetical protein
MQRKSGFSQMLKGMIIGIILILAIIGSMTLFDKKPKNDTFKQTLPTMESNKIEPPTISINPDTNTPDSTGKDELSTANSNSMDDDAKDSDIKTADKEPQEAPQESPQATAVKPTLEGEKTAAEIEAEQKAKLIKYGMLKISAINPASGDSIKAAFTVYDLNNKKVLENKSTNGVSQRLPIGKYKVISTLNKVDEITGKSTPLSQKTQYVKILSDTVTNQVFKLEPPATIGILQVAAISAKNNKPMKANFIIQKEDGNTVATRKNVTNSLFKLKAGNYKVTVKSGNNSDFRTIVVEPGESSKETFLLQEAFKQGRLLVRIFDTRSNTPIKGNIAISRTNGTMVKEYESTSKTEISLVEGDYKIQVTGPNGQSSKIIKIVAGQARNEIFRFDAPQQSNVNLDTQTSNTTNGSDSKNNENGSLNETSASASNPTDTDNGVTIRAVNDKPVDATSQNNVDTSSQATTISRPADESPIPNDDQGKGTLSLFAQNATDNKPLKSNFYIQTLSGKHLDRKIYADSAVFKLNPGTYKITVRSNNRKISVKTITIIANQNTNNYFSLEANTTSTSGKVKTVKTVTPATSAVPTKQAPRRNPGTQNQATIPNGFLKVAMRASRNQRGLKNNLNTHFIVTTARGKKIVELTSVPSGNFKLDTGDYIVTAIHNNKRRSQKVRVLRGKTAVINFNSVDFQNKAIRKGTLRSRIINPQGQPLRANLTVTNTRGQVVARANNVSVGVFQLPPAPHNINVNYRGLRGTESIKITAGETTIQTFTIAPERSAPPSNNRSTQQPQNTKDKFRDKIKEEIRRIF